MPGLRALYVTKRGLLGALARLGEDDPLAVLEAAAKEEMEDDEQQRGPSTVESQQPLVLLVDGWTGDVAPLRRFLARHAVHVSARSERYATEHKAGIGAEESSADPPLPRFLGQTQNDTHACWVPGRTIALHQLVLACDHGTYREQQLRRWFTPLSVCAATPARCFALVQALCGLDCPGARAAAPDAWVAYACGVAASLPPPTDAAGPRRLLTSLSGALQHLFSSVPRSVLLAAGLISTVALQQTERPLTQQQMQELCGLFLHNQREPSLVETPPALFLEEIVR